jgi:hypothetical protein
MTIKLKHLTLLRLIDAAYYCAQDRQPVFIHISAPPGAGKTYATKSLETISGISYFSANYTPTEYKLHIQAVSKHTQLFIHDDVGRCSSRYVPDYISAMCDIIEGQVEYRQYKKNINVDFNFSTVFTSTSGWFYRWKEIMTETGYLDRVLLIQLDLHPDTEKKYRIICSDDALAGCCFDKPQPRKLTEFKKHSSLELCDLKIAPRNIRNILRLSYFLDESEMMELIAVVQTDRIKYSI